MEEVPNLYARGLNNRGSFYNKHLTKHLTGPEGNSEFCLPRISRDQSLKEKVIPKRVFFFVIINKKFTLS